MEKFQPWEMIHCCHGRKWLQTRRAPQAQGDSTRLPYIFYHHRCAHNPHNGSILPGATLLRSHVRLDKRTQFLQSGPNEGGKCQPVQFSTYFCVFVWADLVVAQESLEGSVSQTGVLSTDFISSGSEPEKNCLGHLQPDVWGISVSNLEADRPSAEAWCRADVSRHFIRLYQT